MLQSKNKMLPGEKLIYENVNGVIYARYANKPDIPRWIIGGEPNSVAKAQGKLFDFSTWNDMMNEAKNNSVLKKYLQKAVQVYYLTKEEQ